MCQTPESTGLPTGAYRYADTTSDDASTTIATKPAMFQKWDAMIRSVIVGGTVIIIGTGGAGAGPWEPQRSPFRKEMGDGC